MAIRSTWVLIAAALVAGCASVAPSAPAAGSEGVLSGTVSYRERIALPPDAIVEVWVVDVSPGIVTQQIVAGASIPTQGRQVPIRFDLRYDLNKVFPDRSYALKAVILSQGQTLFEAGDGEHVITKGNPTEVTLLLRRVTQAPAAPAR